MMGTEMAPKISSAAIKTSDLIQSTTPQPSFSLLLNPQISII
jgi:hypothetical protein